MSLRLRVRAHPGARRELVLQNAPGSLEVWVRAPARENQANRAMEHLIAEILGIRVSAVRIMRGLGGREKIVEIDSDDRTILEKLGNGNPD